MSLQTPVRVMMAVVLLLGLVSSRYPVLPSFALLDVSMLVLMVLLALAVAGDRKSVGRRADLWLTGLFFATAAAYAVTACIIYIGMLLDAPVQSVGFNIRDLYFSFSNVRFFGHIQTMLLPFLLIPVMVFQRPRWQRLIFWGIPVIWWVLAVGSGSRGTWVSLAIAAVVVWRFAGLAGKVWVKFQILALMGALVCYTLFIIAMPALVDVQKLLLHRGDNIFSLSNRDALWLTAIQYAMEHPLLGIGPMHFSYWNREIAATPHNAVLLWLSEWGVPAAALMVVLWAWGGLAYAAFVKRHAALGLIDFETLFRAALLAAITGASAQSMIDGVLSFPVSQTLFVLLAGWALGSVKGANATPNFNAGFASRAGLLIVLLTATFGVVQGVWNDIGRLEERQNAFLGIHGQDQTLFPRFWAHGLIPE
jgi:putative inorganic carbon (HCO3(-)) transporter